MDKHITTPGLKTRRRLREQLRFTPAKAQLGHAEAMTTTMFGSVMLTVLIQIVLLSHGVECLDSDSEVILEVPWQAELCCESPPAHLTAEGDADTLTPGTNRSQSNPLPLYTRCYYKNSTHESQHQESSNGTCVDMRCTIDETWENLTCDLQNKDQSPTRLDGAAMAISLQRLLPQNEDTGSDNPVNCEAEDSFMCSVALDDKKSFVTAVTVSISNTVATPVLLRVPARPVRPGPPVNLSHTQTIEAELILHWDVPADSGSAPLRYEVRYSSNTTHPAWQVISAPDPRLSLDLQPKLSYSLQVRCSGRDTPPLWSPWSQPHHIYLDTVSYIPENVVARPGENVTVYCVFNDHNTNASTAMWMLNFHKRLHRSQYHPVNQWVSQITVRPSETRMYDLLQCTKQWTIPYSQIYVEGASIEINCVTNGDIDAMECSWKSKQWSLKLKFRSRWADLPCDVMEERERGGEVLGNMGPSCVPAAGRRSCTISPLRMNCYKLWLEVNSHHLGPIRSKPLYLSPIDHVKPHPGTNVKALTHSRGVLSVSWDPPALPVEGLQCQFRYHSPSTARAQPEWREQPAVRVPWAEVAVSDMCRGFVVQVRCLPTSGTGYWSDWSESVYSSPHNSRAPERGPDFWRILEDDPYRNQTNVTLLFKNLHISRESYCVDGYIVQHQDASGSVMRQKIDPVSSYSFEWNQDVQTVTLEAYNSLGSSANNINITLDRLPKRRSLGSFSVLWINSSCVSLSWSLLDNSSVPLSMVVQWSPGQQQNSDHNKDTSGSTWARLPYTDRPVYLRGDFFGSEDGGFHLFPVFADGEGEPMYTKATRRDPAAYMMLLIILFLAIVLFVTLVLSQNKMKKFVWKDVPNPNKCSWAKGLDLKQTDTFNQLFHPPDGLAALPLLLPPEDISKVVIMDKVDLSALTTAWVQKNPLVSLTTTANPSTSSASSMSLPSGLDTRLDPTLPIESLVLHGGTSCFELNLDSLVNLSPNIGQLQLLEPPENQQHSAQSSVTYSTVVHTRPKQEEEVQLPIHLNYKDGSGSSSGDEGNFSANNSDISGSFQGGLWDLDDPRRSCSYNSVEELSETSEGDVGEAREEKDLYYLGMDYPTEGEGENETDIELLKNSVLNRAADSSVEMDPLLGTENSEELLSSSKNGLNPCLYMPQFRTARTALQ